MTVLTVQNLGNSIPSLQNSPSKAQTNFSLKSIKTNAAKLRTANLRAIGECIKMVA